MQRLALTLLATLLSTLLTPVWSGPLVALPTASAAPAVAPAAGKPWVERAQRRLNGLGCRAGVPDGRLDPWTRSAVLRFQSRHRMAQTGRLTPQVRTRLHADGALRCDRRPVPRGSGKGRRIVVSQAQNWVWLVGPKGGVIRQGGIVDNPSVLRKGWHRTGSYCGRPGRVRHNSSYDGRLRLDHFVRFAACGIGFHRVPVTRSTGRQIHPDWYLGTNLAKSHGCLRLGRAMAARLWQFTSRGTRVRVV